MPRPRKPTQLHIIEGTLNSTRHRGRHGEPQVTSPLGDAPTDWPAPEKAIWHEVVDAVPAGILGKADRLIVELTCRLLIKSRTGECTPALASQLRYCLASLGMTPADRSRVATSPSELMSEADRFFT